MCEGNKPLYYFEDVGRHNAVDKIAGLILKKNINVKNMSFYTTGRLTSEMVIKCIKMRIPILLSRSGFTAWAVEIARKKKLTMIGRLRGNVSIYSLVTLDLKSERSNCNFNTYSFAIRSFVHRTCNQSFFRSLFQNVSNKESEEKKMVTHSTAVTSVRTIFRRKMETQAPP